MEHKAPLPVKDEKSAMMEESDTINRRRFLKTTGIIAGGAILGPSMIFLDNAEAALSAPDITGVTHPASGAVTFTWSAATGASGYKLYYGTSSGNYTVGTADLGNVTTKTFTGLPAGTYYVAFTSYSTTEESEKTFEIMINFGVPVPPTATAAVAGSTVYLVWNGVAGASGYKLYYGTSSRNYAGGPVDLGNVTSQTFIGISSGTYYVALSSYTTSGEGGLSKEIPIIV